MRTAIRHPQKNKLDIQNALDSPSDGSAAKAGGRLRLFASLLSHSLKTPSGKICTLFAKRMMEAS